MRLICLVVVILFSCAHGQEDEIHAEQYGTVELEVKAITMEEFMNREEHFRDVTSWHISRFCKRAEDNCWAADKQIRRFDIIIQSAETSQSNVHVIFYIRDRYDHTRAGLQNHQVRVAFQGQYGDDIETEFGYDMEVVEPRDESMEPWLIAVIVISCVVGVALIITVIVLCCKQSDASAKQAMAEKLIEEELKKTYSMSHGTNDDYALHIDGKAKANPGFDTSSSSDSDSSSDSEEPSTSRTDRQGKNSPPPDYNGDNKGGYTLHGTPPPPRDAASEYINTRI